MNEEFKDKIDLEVMLLRTDKLTGVDKEERQKETMRFIGEECKTNNYLLVEYVSYYFRKCHELS